jgi:hypothetical protein
VNARKPAGTTHSRSADTDSHFPETKNRRFATSLADVGEGVRHRHPFLISKKIKFYQLDRENFAELDSVGLRVGLLEIPCKPSRKADTGGSFPET